MSVIAVKVYEDKIKIASDSIVVFNEATKRTDGNFVKLAKVNGMIIGSSGTAEESSLILHYANTHKPASASEKDVLSFIVEFAQWKRDITGEYNLDNAFIIVYKGKAFTVYNMFVYQVKNYDAIGAGIDFANAALYLGHSPKEAVKVACELSCFVADPIIEYEVDLNKKNKNKKAK